MALYSSSGVIQVSRRAEIANWFKKWMIYTIFFTVAAELKVLASHSCGLSGSCSKSLRVTGKKHIYLLKRQGQEQTISLYTGTSKKKKKKLHWVDTNQTQKMLRSCKSQRKPFLTGMR